jgi:hypothetical protein
MSDEQDEELDLGFFDLEQLPVPVPRKHTRVQPKSDKQSRLNKYLEDNANRLKRNADRSGANYVTDYNPENLKSFKYAWMDPRKVLKREREDKEDYENLNDAIVALEENEKKQNGNQQTKKRKTGGKSKSKKQRKNKSRKSSRRNQKK